MTIWSLFCKNESFCQYKDNTIIDENIVSQPVFAYWQFLSSFTKTHLIRYNKNIWWIFLVEETRGFPFILESYVSYVRIQKLANNIRLWSHKVYVTDYVSFHSNLNQEEHYTSKEKEIKFASQYYKFHVYTIISRLRLSWANFFF